MNKLIVKWKFGEFIEWDMLLCVRRERIYPFRNVSEHPWFVGW